MTSFFIFSLDKLRLILRSHQENPKKDFHKKAKGLYQEFVVKSSITGSMLLNFPRFNIHALKSHKILYVLFILCFSPLVLIANGSLASVKYGEKNLNWSSNYELAVREAKKHKLPILLYFSGSDWCGWCMKLKKEVFESEEFIQQIEKKIICVEIDFPLHTQLSDKEVEYNNALKEKFEVTGYPAIVLIDSSERVLSRLGYLPGGAKKYGEFLSRVIEQDRYISNVLSDFDPAKYSSEELEELYKKSKEFKRVKDAVTFMDAGLKQPNNLFFLSEKYRQLSDKNELVEAQKIKDQLVQKDPKNEKGGLFALALTDFQRLSKQLQSSADPRQAVKPLEQYILEFGSTDSDNVWRIEMMIAQYFFDCNMFTEALTYADKAYSSAPHEMRSEIKRSRDLINTTLSSTAANH